MMNLKQFKQSLCDNLLLDAEWWSLPDGVTNQAIGLDMLNILVYSRLGWYDDSEDNPHDIPRNDRTYFSLLCLEYIKTDGMP